MGHAVPSGRLQVDRATTVPDLSRAFFGGGDEQVSFRLRRDDEIFLGPASFRDQDEFHLSSLHRFASLRVEVVVPNVAAPVDERPDFYLALLRAGEDLVRECGHALPAAGRVETKKVGSDAADP